ncbi:V-type proton ATPase subunit e1 [Castilleja foliolosa]|uniref:V-type proton ATPase subunit e1 n=1 Tax=Castilleja foliolosa TaxID=1961234 RepID=A0ABD3CVV3_9LAMI
MGFVVTSLSFVVIGIIASLCVRLCCNRGPSANLLHLTLVITATVCCWMIVGDRVPCTDETPNCSDFE